MAWIKHKDRTSASNGTWEYKYLNGSRSRWTVFLQAYDNSLVKYLVEEEVIPTVSWSEHYRGTDAEFVEDADVPKKVVESELIGAERQMDNLREKVTELQNLLDK